ncbi:ribonuclease HII [Rhodovulum sp. DZ06]|uniref:ribonuclease HII n=1 Tax=Rhodovulum sp. DZ06 TaxID=3425126 RepID=UPI003D33EF50
MARPSAPRAPAAPRPRPDLSLEGALQRADPSCVPVCGIDEAGRGPWAGPVCAAAVILDPADIPDGIDDSKRLTAKRREALFDEIQARARWGIGFAEAPEIDAIGILPANDLAMARALAALGAAPGHAPGHALIDGNRVPPGFPVPATAVVKGDGKSLSIAAASILAKVARDRVMTALAEQHPGYGWERNMGYGVPAHRQGLKSLGVTPHHRCSFAPIRKILGEGD